MTDRQKGRQETHGAPRGRHSPKRPKVQPPRPGPHQWANTQSSWKPRVCAIRNIENVTDVESGGTSHKNVQHPICKKLHHYQYSLGHATAVARWATKLMIAKSLVGTQPHLDYGPHAHLRKFLGFSVGLQQTNAWSPTEAVL
ncbi:hypothetical protein NE237_011702 [Protea cynaroides]|uniref:Uncharacterized protein n=1 Tax=Protea cynaroides TaxID=273540 RepID=A0A9Q0JW34_9MAGN|nr:hypothetical protein NE237_011702 [Protea cynaroides]